MDWSVFGKTFGIVFAAEIGDRTQLATLALAAGSPRPFSVFLGAWLALGVTSALGVAVGGALGRFFPGRLMLGLSGAAMLLLGAVLVWKSLWPGAPAPA